MVNLGQNKIEKYYNKTNKTPVYTAAVVLNPQCKWQYIDRFWREPWRAPARTMVKKLWDN